ncbi:hypothetical protein BRARA_C02681 [Brassica rapa]|uniref:F-box domain-containing protein n=2 Tax=Brassica TaxID=3705 RepID=A0A397ZYU7_BRACM|nr:putative F-box protein At4g11580 [Brassica napus]KAH0933481.1 hypothetical protein HID58_010598 [Brassica napus]RID70681.1 hypothetical protein BRARA_C02681 [Brassica rapa]CAF2125223.1 unnamed protein product [Brassica napus]VDC80917.1 unnamed protein product [Brassica rapa]
MDKADSSRQVSKWKTLDRGILSVIFRKLNVEDLTMGASGVCISWFLAAHNKSLWNTVDLDKFRQTDKDLRLNELRYRIVFTENFKDSDISETRRSLRNITKFSRSAPVNLVFGCCSSLDDEILMFAAASMPNIEKLVLPRWCYLSKNSFGFAFSKWKNLKTLIVAHDVPLTETFEFQIVGENCSNLTNLKYLGGLGKETAEEIVRYFKNIKRLSLQSAYVSRPGVLLLITGLQNLAILNVSHCKEFDDETVTMDNIVQAATQKRVRFILCSNNCTCRNKPWLEGLTTYGSESWRNDEIKELEF